MDRVNYIARQEGRLTVSGAPEGYDAWLAAHAAESRKGVVLFVAQDGVKAASAVETIRFFAPQVQLLTFPSWDCLPYDRMSPSPDIESQRLATLATLARRGKDSGAAVVVTTINAVLQRVPPRDVIKTASFAAKIGDTVSHEDLARFLAANGYARASTVREPGDFAVRGGIVDLWPPGLDPLRLDFFGDRLDAIRTFDAETQLSSGEVQNIDLLPASEVPLDEAGVSRFRRGYVAAFGPAIDDPLYESVSAARKAPGMEHWLPLFYEKLETLFDYAPRSLVMLSHHSEEARKARLELVTDYYQTRREFLDSDANKKGALKAPPYKPLKPETLYLTHEEWEAMLKAFPVRELTPFQAPESMKSVDAHGKLGRDFAPERAQGNVNVFQLTAEHIVEVQKEKKRVIIAAWTEGSSERMGGVLSDHGVKALRPVADWHDAAKMAPSAIGLAVLGIEHGFEAPDFVVIAEQDILGDRMVSHKRARKAQNFLTEAAGLAPGDLVTHIEHGVGRYLGLKTIDVTGAPHDCLELQYDGGKLFLPVENIELLTRYGGDDSNAVLDKLGGTAWQSRKAKARERVREIAGELIRIAAARELKTLPEIEKPQGLWDEFCARFPYQETEDQEKAIADAVEDLAKGRPMDRLVCGDVGFGKTEVALRTAFVAAMSGSQVAVVVPTTLLARQHYRSFAQRFAGFPVKVRQLSRFVDAKEARETKEGLKSGDIDIVIGTHALLAKNIEFTRLGLVIVDEEQHFGVSHKERLKNLKADVHVLTLTATPIPRTLQLALSGVRDLSLITTPPIDRLAVRTYVTPFDPMVIREALLREHYRGGQSFYVCPRISDLREADEFLKENVPEVKAAVAHGQMAATALEEIMTAFYDRKIDVLISTNIVESGLDVPNANTMIVHRADMFGLSQLYQIRGRIGRSKQRAYAYLTTPADHKPTETAERRLEVLQSLDQLGAGFTVASHDMDIRGAGNLLGEEQSGHVKEVGIELYQEMLEEAVASLKEGGDPEKEATEQWSPNINIGAAVLIPEAYVPDLNVRMALYRRLSTIETRADMDRFAAELIDRFGPLPEEVKHLFEIVQIKQMAKKAGVDKIDAGPKGGVIGFRNNQFANPLGLVKLISESPTSVKVRPDQKIVISRVWETPEQRLKGVQGVLTALVKLVA
ncbi:transcription-repair coupling factor (superfamily II helicase) [Rhizomicrobium palustre]|uniref:Transcription-repair-coupling factor n=1 Tax=Rhizomicrobium palustre TaxID=189966 RepID=A0A846MTP9_9PROT|nr:transcription-repair coupling factor [Rhizomicrobium palustre]NIK86878.1 transcription-repair coupling factor (superfamily II helicase) [Rhizomicrobium palustre]